MSFKIPKEENINKTFRLKKELVERLDVIAHEKGISMNKLVALCCEYALEHLDKE